MSKHKTTGGTLYLEARLTEAEIRESGKRLAEGIERRAIAEGRMDTFKTQIKAELAEIEAVILKQTSMVATEREFRLVPVEIEYDFEAGKKTFVRKDTGEIVKTEPISEEERQLAFPVN